MRVVSLDGLPAFQSVQVEEPNLCVFLGRVGDHSGELFPEEQSSVSSSAEQRQREFAAGRRLAHIALEEFGLTPVPIGRDHRKPVFPGEVLGSITHSKHLASCAMAKAEDFLGIGVDIAMLSEVSEYVAQRVLDDVEREWIEKNGSHEWWTVFFAAKESVYKAVNPVIGEYLGFGDVRIEVQSDSLTFEAVTTSNKKSTEAISRGRGVLHRIEGHWLTTFVVDHA